MDISPFSSSTQKFFIAIVWKIPYLGIQVIILMSWFGLLGNAAPYFKTNQKIGWCFYIFSCSCQHLNSISISTNLFDLLLKLLLVCKVASWCFRLIKVVKWIIEKMLNILTFGYYIRSIFQFQQFAMVSVFYELYLWWTFTIPNFGGVGFIK